MTFDAVLIAGPTTSGKSAAALALAECINGQIINADSMQVYAEAPILTARPSMADIRSVPHALYGHISVWDAYSVGRYATDAAIALEEARRVGKVPIFVGGTGLYFMALTQGLAHVPPTPPYVREAARALLDKIGVAELHARLAAKDPKTAALLRPTDPQRTLRAYEVLEATGRPLVDWQQSPPTSGIGAPILKDLRLAKFVFAPPRPKLRERIAVRFEAMLDQGALAEARALQDLDPMLPAAKLLGLRPLIGLAEGSLSRAEALELAIVATRQFAKRQMTWFRHRMIDYIWIDPDESNIITILSHNST